MQLLQQLNNSGMTLVMVTHDVYLKNFAHRVIYMRDGKIEKIETISPALREGALGSLVTVNSSTKAKGSGGLQSGCSTMTRTVEDYPMIPSKAA